MFGLMEFTTIVCNLVCKSPQRADYQHIAERTRFELVEGIAPFVGLANRWFQPLTHLSGSMF